MSLKGLVRHPVGRTSAAGRWYLAGAAILALLLLSLHFAVQAEVQQQARDVVSRWAQQQGVSVADVQYRMMRGALTLENFRFHKGGVNFAAATLTLQGDITSFLNKQPRLSLLELRGLRLDVDEIPQDFWIADGAYSPVLARLWRSARAIVMEGGDIRIGGSGGFPHQPVDMELLRFRAQGAAGARQARGLFHLLGGHVELQLEEAWEGDSAPKVQALTHWEDIDASSFLPAVFGGQPVLGAFDGIVDWRAQAGSRVESQGAIEFSSADMTSAPAKLKWQGSFAGGQWQGGLETARWPLVMLTEQLPLFASREVDGGMLDGRLEVSRSGDGWHIAGDGLAVSDLYLQRQVSQGEEAYVWEVSRALLDGLNIDAKARQFRVGSLELEGVDARFDPVRADGQSDEWDVRVGEVVVRDFRPSVYLGEDRRLYLPAFAGAAKWKGGGWQVELKSDGPERWLLSGQAYLQGSASTQLTLKAVGAPLVRFRSMLPPLLRSGEAELEGTVGAKAELSEREGVWHLVGDVQVANVHFGLLGDNWFADSIKIDALRADASGRAHARDVRLQGWKYRAPLYPLAQPAQQAAPAEHADVREWFGAWQIDRLLMKKGQVAVGQSDAIWLQDTEVELAGIGPEADAVLSVRSRFDGGVLNVKGRIGLSSPRPDVKELKVTVRDALPFFARDWLRLSGLPAVTRGRLYADLSARQDGGEWRGTAYVRLQRGGLEEGVFAEDVLLERTGFNAYELFSRLSDGQSIRVKIPLAGHASLASVLGEGFVNAARQDAERSGSKIRQQVHMQTLSQVRLHERDALSHNERTRLRSAIEALKRNPKWVVELVPQLGGRELDDEAIRQVRYTQQLMAVFMEVRGISRTRVFPVWPGVLHRDAAGSSGISLLAGPAS